MIVDVLISTRFYLKETTTSEGGREVSLELPNGSGTKQFILGFFNPIPEILADSCKPVLYLEFLVKGVSHSGWFRDDEEVSIVAKGM